MKFEGKVAIVTGAASGIGKATAILFAQEGAYVYACDLDEGALKNVVDQNQNLPGKIIPYKLNVTDREEISNFAEYVIKESEKIDILINNAGITADNLLIRMKEDEWDRVISVNLKGVFNMTQAIIPHMLRKKTGVVLSTASVVGIYGNPGQTNYTATKAGVIAMSKSWAKEYGKKGIRFNTVAPGFISTPMTDKLPEKALQAMLEKIPLQRPGTPEDVAKAFLFLASDDASYITSQTLCVDGGLIF